jgi:serine/threonine protein kinase
MTANDDLQVLLDSWEDLRAQGQQVSAEELCCEHPELLQDVKKAISTLQALDQILEDDEQAMPPVLSLSQPSADSPGRDGKARQETAKELVSQDTQPVVLGAGVELVPGYFLEHRLGKGGFGEVWKATGPGGFGVALKVVALEAKAGPAELRALEIMKELRHPHLLALFGAWVKDNHLIVAMELADRTLIDRFEEVRQQGLSGIPAEELLGYMEDAAKGIDFLNTPTHVLESEKPVGIEHRDIKPQNLLLVGGSVKVADFGLAQVLGTTVASHSGSMTPSYAAPEFLNGRTHRHSDQYSLAVSYCLLRGGRLPFEGSPAQVMTGHLHGEPDLTMLSEGEHPVVARALAKDPEERWPTCGSFVEGLRDAIARKVPAGGKVRRSQVSSLQKSWDHPYRLPLHLLVAAASLLLVVGLTGRALRTPSTTPDIIEEAKEGEWEVEGDIEGPKTSKPASSATATELCNLRGENLRLKGEWQKAIDLFGEALKHDQKYVPAYLNRSAAYDNGHQYKLAIADCDEALRILPSEEKDLIGLAYARRGNAYRHSGNADQAIADYTKSLEYVPDSPKVYYFRGVAYATKGDRRKAERDKEKGRQLGYKPGR